jgi:hypothetical protein
MFEIMRGAPNCGSGLERVVAGVTLGVAKQSRKEISSGGRAGAGPRGTFSWMAANPKSNVGSALSWKISLRLTMRDFAGTVATSAGTARVRYLGSGVRGGSSLAALRAK